MSHSSFKAASEARWRGGEPSLHDLLHVGLLEQDEGVSEFEEDEVRVPTEPVALANVLRDHNLALAGHLHDVHTGVKRVLLLRPCPNGAKVRKPKRNDSLLRHRQIE